MALIVDLEPKKIQVIDEDYDSGEKTYYNVWIREFSEADVKVRTRLLSANISEEDSRRGRSQRGQQGGGQREIHIERIRQFNFERGVVKWDFVYPETYWDETEMVRKPHPQAGQMMPITREIYELIPERIMDQIVNKISALNEPPEELPEIRDENGHVTQEEQHSPLEQNSVVKLEQH